MDGAGTSSRLGPWLGSRLDSRFGSRLGSRLGGRLGERLVSRFAGMAAAGLDGHAGAAAYLLRTLPRRARPAPPVVAR